MLIKVRFLRKSNGVHDQQRRFVFEAEASIAVFHHTADIINNVHLPRLQDLGHHPGSPGVYRKFWRPDLGTVARLQFFDCEGKGINERKETIHFLPDTDSIAVGSGTFRADINDISAVENLADCLVQGFFYVERAVT